MPETQWDESDPWGGLSGVLPRLFVGPANPLLCGHSASLPGSWCKSQARRIFCCLWKPTRTVLGKVLFSRALCLRFDFITASSFMSCPKFYSILNLVFRVRRTWIWIPVLPRTALYTWIRCSAFLSLGFHIHSDGNNGINFTGILWA